MSTGLLPSGEFQTTPAIHTKTVDQLFEANVSSILGQMYEKESRLHEAEAEYLEKLECSPEYLKAMYKLSRLYRETGDETKEYEYLKSCLDTDPDFPLTYFYLARIYLRRGERYREAIDLVKKGIDLKPERAELPLGYFLLADLYNRLSDQASSRKYAEKGQQLAASAAGANPRS